MTPELIRYLEHIRYNSRLEFSKEREVISEIESHIEDRLRELTESGLSEEEAIQICLGHMGAARLVARQIYETYNQGTWKQVLLASTPHLLFGLLFALNWWRYVGWISVVLCLVLGTTVYGWWHGKPTWIFPWLGYSLLPVLAFGLILLYLPRGWPIVAIPLYFPLALWWLVHIIIQSARKDCLFSSLMLLPIPIIIGWFLAISPGGRFAEDSLDRTYYLAPWIGLSFLVLALTIATFIRVKQRWLRVWLLVISGLLTLTLVIYYSSGQLTTLTFLGLVLVMCAVFLLPPLLERWLRNGRLRYRKSEIAPG